MTLAPTDVFCPYSFALSRLSPKWNRTVCSPLRLARSPGERLRRSRAAGSVYSSPLSNSRWSAGHAGASQLLPVASEAAVDMRRRVSWGVELLRHVLSLCLTLLRSSQTTLQHGCTIWRSHPQGARVPPPPHPQQRFTLNVADRAAYIVNFLKVVFYSPISSGIT